MDLIIPQGYSSYLDVCQTEIAIKNIKDFFERRLADKLNLTRVSAPLYVVSDSGLNDDLNGVERPVVFNIKSLGDRNVEIVHSLAKWKRVALKRYEFPVGNGIYTDMNAIRRDEDLDNLHSTYVDQWDWELIIDKNDRNIDTLKKIVNTIFKVFKDTENYLRKLYPQLQLYLPEEITFISSQELLDLYPDKTPKEREDLICKKYKAVFVYQIGDKLSDGKPHDGRAPDYDDWSLNGDILFWFPVLNCAFEVTSMGIRVDEDSLKSQLEKANALDRIDFQYHQEVLNSELPYTIGGGIGQSRICMFFLHKAHIGEVQVSIWPEEMAKVCEENGIKLL